MKAFSIAAVNLRRIVRDRTSVFFVVVFPLLLILVLGLAYGGTSEPRVGVVASQTGPLAADLVRRLEDAAGFGLVHFNLREDLVTAVEHGEVEAGLSLPADYDAQLAGGATVELQFLARSGLTGQQISSIANSVVQRENARLQAARFAALHNGADPAAVLATVDSLAGTTLLSVDVRSVGTAALSGNVGQFDVGASSQLVLFVFLNSMTGAVALIETRRLGLSRRMVTTPTPTRTIVLGEGLGRFAIAAVQAVVIIAGSTLLFEVGWGNPVAAAALTIAFCIAASGAGMLLATSVRTSQQAIAVGLLLGLGLGAIGGAMMPLEFFSAGMRTAAHFTPHAWALDGFARLLREDGGLLDVALSVGVLLAVGAALFALAGWRFRQQVGRR